ncbi:MAG TPA: YfhO family protein, partial [Oscillatoriaceae cyanobacterium]
DLLSVRWLRMDADLPARAEWHSRLPSSRWKPVSEKDGVRVYENLRALPRAWRPRRALVLPTPNVDALLTDSAEFSATQTALLEQAPSLKVLSPGDVTLAEQSFNRLTLRTQGAGPGLVIVSEGYDPGWRAFDGGTRLKVERVDGVLLGIEVPAGRHQVELRYAPPYWNFAEGGSGVSLVLAIAWALRATRKRRGVVQVFGWNNSRVA